MVHVEDEIRVDAPAREVFEYVDVPEHLREITPSISSVETAPGGGRRARYDYEMAGVGIDLAVRTAEHDPPERLVLDVGGDLDGTVRWSFDPGDDATQVRWEADYEIPVPVLESVAEPLVRRYNRREVRRILANLREQFEAAD